MNREQQECYVWTYNEINSFVYWSKDECLKVHEKQKEYLKDIINSSGKYTESEYNRECDSLGVFVITDGRNSLSSTWVKTYIK